MKKITTDQNLDSLADRYASIRLKYGLSKKDFAASLGIHPVVSGDIELGKRDPSRDVLVRLARTYAIDITWLLTGTFSTSIPSVDDDERFVPIELVNQQVAAGSGVEIAEYTETTSIPVLRSFIAPRKSECVRAVEVRGDSMTGIGLDDGDIVFFASNETTGDGVHVITIGNRLLVKRIHMDPVGKIVHVISENQRYQTRILQGPDLDDFRIEGRVIGWMHRA